MFVSFLMNQRNKKFRCNSQKKNSAKYEFICEKNWFQFARRRIVIYTDTYTHSHKTNCPNRKNTVQNNDLFPYKIAVNIQCSLTFSCMCVLYGNNKIIIFLYIYFFHAYSLSHSRKTCKRLQKSKANQVTK